LLTLFAPQDMFDAQITNICLGVQSIIEKMEAQGVRARVMDSQLAPADASAARAAGPVGGLRAAPRCRLPRDAHSDKARATDQRTQQSAQIFA
jgi:hypothetical protein